MPKLLPDDDFRAKRVVLTREDFAYAPKPAPPPSDVVSKATWKSIVTLPDDVAVRTSNYHGTTLGQLNDLWSAWIESFGSTPDSLSAAMLDAGDDFQSATYTALTGFYRLSIVALRSALELGHDWNVGSDLWQGEEFRQVAGRGGIPLYLEKHVMASLRQPNCWANTFGVLWATASLIKKIRRARGDLLGGYTAAYLTSHIRDQDTLTAICARATARSMFAQCSNMWRGYISRPLACASCFF